jgi:hypothetical protein
MVGTHVFDIPHRSAPYHRVVQMQTRIMLSFQWSYQPLHGPDQTCNHSYSMHSSKSTDSLLHARRRSLAIIHLRPSQLTPQSLHRTPLPIFPLLPTPLHLLIPQSTLSSFLGLPSLLLLYSLLLPQNLFSLNLCFEKCLLVFLGFLAVLAYLVCGERRQGEDPGVDGAGAAVASVGEVVGAFVGRGGCEADFFVAAGGLEFVVAAHLGDLRLIDGVVFLMFLRWMDGWMDGIGEEMLMYEKVCSSYLILLQTWYILMEFVRGGCVDSSSSEWNLYNCLIQGVANHRRR